MDLTEYWVVYCISAIIYGIVFGFICKAVLDNKGYVFHHGFAWGFWLGWIGLIVCALKPQVVNRYSNQDWRSKENSIYSNEHSSNSLFKESDKTWVCAECGRINSDYFSTCDCGVPKTLNYQHRWKCEVCGGITDNSRNMCDKCRAKRAETIKLEKDNSQKKIETKTENKSVMSIDKFEEESNKLKKLRDLDVITEEEYNEKIKQLKEEVRKNIDL